MSFFISALVGGTLLFQVPPPPPPPPPAPQAQPQTPGSPRPQQAPSPPGTPQPTPQPQPMPQPQIVPQPNQPNPNQPNPNQPNQNPQGQPNANIQAGKGVPNGRVRGTITSVDLTNNMMVFSQPTGVAGGQTFTRFTVPANATFRTADNQLLTGRFKSTMFDNPQQLNVPVQVSFDANGQISEIRLMDAAPQGTNQQGTAPPTGNQTRPAPPQTTPPRQVPPQQTPPQQTPPR
jgi:hypothetical protein